MTAANWRHVRTERLWLDVADDGDIDDLHEIHAHPDTWLHFPTGRHTERLQAARMVERGNEQWAEDGLGFWSIRDQPDGPVIGRGGCAVAIGRPWWNLYYRFHPDVHRRGYAVEMARAAIEAAHAVRPERPVLAFLLEHNEASRRTAERAGLMLVWRGPDRDNPDPDAVRLVFLDREPDEETRTAILFHCEVPGAS